MSFNLGIVVADFNKEMTHKMLQFVQQEAAKEQQTIVEVAHAPGVYDIPLLVQLLLEKKEIDGVITLGVVLQGGTNHDVVVAENAGRKIADLSCQFGKPVTLGIIGPRVNKQLAEERLESYAEHAYHAVISLLNEKQRLTQLMQVRK